VVHTFIPLDALYSLLHTHVDVFIIFPPSNANRISPTKKNSPFFRKKKSAKNPVVDGPLMQSLRDYLEGVEETAVWRSTPQEEETDGGPKRLISFNDGGQVGIIVVISNCNQARVARLMEFEILRQRRYYDRGNET
jgi:hypothetical protein